VADFLLKKRAKYLLQMISLRYVYIQIPAIMKRKNDGTNDNRLKIGANIRKWRNIKEMKQKDLASALQLSEAAISNIENDLTDVSLRQLEDISTALNIPVEKLFSDPQDSFVLNESLAPYHTERNHPFMDKELLNAMLNSLQKKDEQLQSIMQNVLHTMSALLQDEKKIA
jgi:transcriptional regulator with XRE-family HTH domain